MTLETKVQLLQKAAFGDVDVEKGLAAFHVSLQEPSSLCHLHVLLIRACEQSQWQSILSTK